MHRAHLALMNDQIVIESWQGSDDFGAESYGAATEYQGRVRGEIKLVRNREGQEVVSSTRVTVPGPPEGPDSIDPRSRITLADGSTPPILEVGEAKDERGVIDHFTVRLA